MQTKGSILLVEDDYNLACVIRKRLEEEGFEVFVAVDGVFGWQQFLKRHYDICLLDIVMPKKNGYELAKLIRSKSELIPILFLTAKAQDEDKIKGFKYGGDDYIVKPFSLQELLLRIEVWLKRTRTLSGDKDTMFKIGKLIFDYPEMIITNTKTNESTIITPREADLLKFFLINANKTIKREEILYHVWGKDDYFLGRSMDVFITKIRKRIEGQKGIELKTLHGIGFKLIIEEKS